MPEDGRRRAVNPAPAPRAMPAANMAVGAELLAGGGARFRVWAPKRRTVSASIEGRGDFVLQPEPGGYHSAVIPLAMEGDRYRFRLDDDATLYPDPASRFQPDGPHGASELIDPHGFAWSDDAWPGCELAGQVLYEMHVGTFTPAGTFAAAAAHLAALADLGITAIELMPVADFPGRFGWGYDGVNWFAPTRLYGRPDDFRRFVDHAHALGLGVILDVVYNHFGPDGNFLSCFADDYISQRYANEWGEALNFDGPNSTPVRELAIENARYWMREYHLDGLRLDATQQIFDASPCHLVAELTTAARAAASPRRILVFAENEKQEARLARPAAAGGMAVDALWNDDFHHTARVALTGRAEAYYSDHQGTPQELLSAVKWGFLFQGQHYAWQQQRRGHPALDLPAMRLVTFLENHDQVANAAAGRHLHQLAAPGRLRALTALFLLAPATPLLFQGQEFAASAPFLYFADHAPDLAAKVRAGRAEFVMQFPSVTQDMLHDPADLECFLRCKLDQGERTRHATSVRLHRSLLRLRRGDPTFAAQDGGRLQGAVLGAEALLLRFFGAQPAGDRLLLINLGRDLALASPAEPLLAPPVRDQHWQLVWSSEDPAFGGCGTPPVEREGRWFLPGHVAIVMRPATQGEGIADG